MTVSSICIATVAVLTAGCSDRQRGGAQSARPTVAECRLGRLIVELTGESSCFPTKAAQPGLGLAINSRYPSGLAIAAPASVPETESQSDHVWFRALEREKTTLKADYKSLSKPASERYRHVTIYFVEGIPHKRPDSIKREGYLVSGPYQSRFVEYLPASPSQRKGVEATMRKALDGVRLGE